MERYRLTQAVLMAALGLFLAERLWSGGVFFYINQRFTPLIAFGAAAAFVLALGAAWMARREAGPEHAHEHGSHTDQAHSPSRFPFWTVALLALPVVLGLAIPARPLGASAIESRGLNTGPVAVSGTGAAVQLEIAPAERTILDWVRAFNYADDVSAFNDQPADVIGFVYRSPALSAEQFMVSRFIVTCCAADASGIAMLVNWPDAPGLAENSWVRVRGPVRAAELNGQPIPLITAASVEPVAQPEHPYMYP